MKNISICVIKHFKTVLDGNNYCVLHLNGFAKNKSNLLKQILATIIYSDLCALTRYYRISSTKL